MRDRPRMRDVYERVVEVGRRVLALRVYQYFILVPDFNQSIVDSRRSEEDTVW